MSLSPRPMDVSSAEEVPMEQEGNAATDITVPRIRPNERENGPQKPTVSASRVASASKGSRSQSLNVKKSGNRASFRARRPARPNSQSARSDDNGFGSGFRIVPHSQSLAGRPNATPRKASEKARAKIQETFRPDPLDGLPSPDDATTVLESVSSDQQAATPEVLVRDTIQVGQSTYIGQTIQSTDLPQDFIDFIHDYGPTPPPSTDSSPDIAATGLSSSEPVEPERGADSNDVGTTSTLMDPVVGLGLPRPATRMSGTSEASNLAIGEATHSPEYPRLRKQPEVIYISSDDSSEDESVQVLPTRSRVVHSHPSSNHSPAGNEQPEVALDSSVELGPSDNSRPPFVEDVIDDSGRDVSVHASNDVSVHTPNSSAIDRPGQILDMSTDSVPGSFQSQSGLALDCLESPGLQSTEAAGSILAANSNCLQPPETEMSFVKRSGKWATPKRRFRWRRRTSATDFDSASLETALATHSRAPHKPCVPPAGATKTPIPTACSSKEVFYSHVDPRSLVVYRRTPQWYVAKGEEIARRPRRKAFFGQVSRRRLWCHRHEQEQLARRKLQFL